MTRNLERLGLYKDGTFHKNGVKVEAIVLGLGITNDKDNPENGNYIPKNSNAYVIGNRETPTSNRFPLIYLKKL